MRRPWWAHWYTRPVLMAHIYRHNRHSPNVCTDPDRCGEWIARHI